MWAVEVRLGRYQLRNSPFYAYEVSLEDIVEAERGEDGQLVFKRVTIRGGHSTYRLVLEREISSSDFQRHWEPLERLGCSYEGKDSRLLSVDVPARADVAAVFRLLEQGERDGTWDFEEAHCAQPAPSS